MELGKIASFIPLVISSSLPAMNLELLPIKLTPEQTKKFARLIQRNECSIPVTITWWKIGEDHASLGIGHWIWYPKDAQRTTPESFPALLKFLSDRGQPLPAGILDKDSFNCPWHNQKEFMTSLHSPKMKLLRAYLYQTIDLQAEYIMQRLDKGLQTILKNIQSPQDKEFFITQINRLLPLEHGLYALIDYLNFKGEGVDTCPQYKGHHWGLKQVILAMNSKEKPLVAFVEAAKKILQRRIDNAPEEKKAAEQSWRQGWFNRLETYLAED